MQLPVFIFTIEIGKDSLYLTVVGSCSNLFYLIWLRLNVATLAFSFHNHKLTLDIL